MQIYIFSNILKNCITHTSGKVIHMIFSSPLQRRGALFNSHTSFPDLGRFSHLHGVAVGISMGWPTCCRVRPSFTPNPPNTLKENTNKNQGYYLGTILPLSKNKWCISPASLMLRWSVFIS